MVCIIKGGETVEDYKDLEGTEFFDSYHREKILTPSIKAVKLPEKKQEPIIKDGQDNIYY